MLDSLLKEMFLFLSVLPLGLLSLVAAATLEGDKIRPEDFQEEDYQDRNFVSPPSDIQYYNRNLELELDLSPLSSEEWQLLGLLERIQVTIEREAGKQNLPAEPGAQWLRLLKKFLTKLSSSRPKLLEFLDKLKSLPELDHGLNVQGLQHFLKNNGLEQHIETPEVEGLHNHLDGPKTKADFLQYVAKEPRIKRSVVEDTLYQSNTEDDQLEMETILEEFLMEDSHKLEDEEVTELSEGEHGEDDEENVFDEGRFEEKQEDKSVSRVTTDDSNLWIKFLKSGARHRNS